MPRRLKLIVAYDGAPFAGWQSQAHGNTVQDHLEKAFRLVTQQTVRVHGAGRTDTGVHALAQCAHVDPPKTKLTTDRWVAALNGSLPPTIRILRCQNVSEAFHARFSARGKIYRYRIWNARVLPPLEHHRAWHIPGELDLNVMRSEAKAFVGGHDFTSFAANRGKPEHDPVRTIDSVLVRKKGALITLDFSGDGFLYKMVRLMVGALVRAGRGPAAQGEISARLATPKRIVATARFVAPADGLYLMRVRY